MACSKTTTIGNALEPVLPEDRVRRLAAEREVVRRNRKVDIFALVWTLALGFQVGHDLPVALRLDLANASNHVASIETLDWLRKQIDQHGLDWTFDAIIQDAGHTGEPNHTATSSTWERSP